MRVKTGTYTGDGVDNRDITGLGFEPAFVLLNRASGGTAGRNSIFRIAGMQVFSADTSIIWEDSGFPLTLNITNGVKRFLLDGFRLGTGAQANASGIVYHWVAFGADPDVFEHNVYGTDNTDDRPIEGFGFQPDFLFGGLGESEGFDHHHWFATKGGDNSHRVADTTFNEANYFQQALPNGMEVGSDQNFHSVSTNLVYYIGLKNNTGNILQGSYTGDGVFGRSVTGLGFKPQFVWIRREGASVSCFRFASQDAGNSYFAGSTGEQTTGIQDFIEDGFTVGSTGETNTNTDTYHFIAVADPEPVGAVQVATGTYTGTGVSQGITGLGFAPVFVITRNITTASGATALRTSAMGGVTSVGWDQFSGDFRFTNAITSLDADGFTVLSNLSANNSGDTYHWVAFGADPDTLFNGSYTGNGADDRKISGVGFRADALLGARSTPSGADWGWWFKTLAGDATILVARDDDSETDRFQDSIDDAIEVGTIFNFSGTTHFFTAFRIANNIAQGSYVGNGTSQSITGLGFQPDIVFVKKNTNFPNGDRTIYRQATQAGDATFKLQVSGQQTGMITSLDSDGFSVGSAVEANDSGDTYHYLAIANSFPATPPAPSTTVRIATTSYTGDGVDDRVINFTPSFSPVAVFIQRDATPFEFSMRTTAMSVGDSLRIVRFGVLETNRIKDMSSGSVTIGTADQVNKSGDTYHLIALGGDSDLIQAGSYTGDGLDNRLVSLSPSMIPDFILVKRSISSTEQLWFNSRGGDNAMPFSRQILGMAPGFIRDEGTGSGFRVGFGPQVNGSGDTYFYLVIKRNPGNVMQTDYFGIGIDDRPLFADFIPQPDWVLLRNIASNNDEGLHRPASLGGDFTFEVAQQTAPDVAGSKEANKIQSLLSGGGFEIGSNSNVNNIASLSNYMVLAIADLAPPPIPLEAPSILPVESILRQSIANIMPVELLRRIAQRQNMHVEFNVTEIIAAGQVLPLEALLGVADAISMPVDTSGTTRLLASQHLTIEMIGALAAQMNLEIEALARQVTEQRIPFEALAGVGTPSNVVVEMLGSIRIETGPNMAIEFLQGVQTPPVLPVDSFGVTVLKAPANMPIESIVGLIANMLMPVDAQGIGLAIAALFQVIRPLEEPLSLEFVVIPLQVLGTELPINFTIENILGKKLSISFRILPDDILTLFGEDIQFPFGRADKNP